MTRENRRSSFPPISVCNQAQQDSQHLVEFQGRTLCLWSHPRVSCILHALFTALNVPRHVIASFDVPWRIISGGKFLAMEEIVPPLAMLHVWTGGLKGGKGGFGAMLRAMAKQAGKKPTTDFGACRDLQGRRLRHVNDEIRLQKWSENRERESRGDKVEELKTPSGIDGWHLEVPTWAEGAKQSFMKTRRKTVLCQQWLDARKERDAPKGAPAWWGCPRGRGCDFAHGKEELRGKGLEDFIEREREEKRDKRHQELDKYVRGSSAEEITRDMSSAIEQGLKAAAKASQRRATEQAEATRELLGVDLHGREVKLLTAGLMQIGWADHTFVEGGPETDDGVGDVKGSWAFDGVRQKKWNETEADYGDQWKVNDVVGCSLEIDGVGQSASFSFTLNGESMGVAFENVPLAPEAASTNDLLKEEAGFFPAFSLEEGEAIVVNLGQEAFVHPPPEGFSPVITARKGATVKLGKHLRDLDDSALRGSGIGNGAGDMEEGGAVRIPLDLEGFSCATELAESYGPGRLKQELEERGVKCGGTHYQRAARLFSLKRLAPDDYPPELLAKKTKKAR